MSPEENVRKAAQALIEFSTEERYYIASLLHALAYKDLVVLAPQGTMDLEEEIENWKDLYLILVFPSTATINKLVEQK